MGCAVTRLLAIPGLCAALLFGLSGARALFAGSTLVWPPVPVTLSDAAAMRDLREMTRQIAAGADPNAAAPVVYGFRFDRPVMMTPLEAAVGDHNIGGLVFLEEHGARLDEDTARRLACFARRIGDESLDAYLVSRARTAVTCDGVRVPW